MIFAVGIACVMVVAVLGEVAGTPKHQPLVKDHGKIEDGSSFILRDDLEKDLEDLKRHTKMIKKNKTNFDCRILGGKCEHKKHECHGGYGWCFEGKDYCRHHAHYCCCVPPPKEGCVFGDKAYPHKAFIKQACFKIQCLDGVWNINVDDIDPSCARCSAYPVADINPFDRNSFKFNQTGHYTFFHDYSDYYGDGVDVAFVNCTQSDIVYSCVESVYFHEIGFNIKITLGNPYTVNDDSVEVNYRYVIVPTGSVSSFYGTRGTVLVYKESALSYYLVSSIGISVHISRQGNHLNETFTTLTLWTTLPLHEKSYSCLCDGDQYVKSNDHPVAGQPLPESKSNDHPVAGRPLPESKSNDHPVVGRPLPESIGLDKKIAIQEWT